MSRRLDQESRYYPEEEASNFFETATIGTFYKTNVPNPRYLELSPEQMSRWFTGKPLNTEESKNARAERRAYARALGVEWIDEYNATRKGWKEGLYYLVESPAPKLTYWFPYYEERRLILSLAESLTKPGAKPTVLEAGCGSGITSKLLAAEKTARVIGVDSDLEGMGATRIPQTPGDVQLRSTDFWNILEEFGPTYPKEVAEERQRLLQKVREEYAKKPVFEILTLGALGVNSGDSKRLTEEVTTLQEQAGYFKSPSPVDLVLCSFMETGVDLTVPIRDGIYPKAIVYVRPVPPLGFSGAGDFYFDSTIDENEIEDFTPTPDTPISFNPGRNYQTLVRWMTHAINNWQYSADRPHFSTPFNTEVVIQIRKDIALRPRTKINCNRYPFDADFEEGFRREEDFHEFLVGVQQALDSVSTSY